MGWAVTRVETVFEEWSAASRVASIPLSHLSIELGHLYMENFAAGPRRLRELFSQVAPWVRTAQDVCAAGIAPQRPRVSTCFLIDDYFGAFGSPREVLPMVIDAATAAGLRIDYVAREASCVEAHDNPLADLVVARLVADPPPGSNGTRPMVHETGWLCNGVRSPQVPLGEAMRPTVAWQPPSENAANRHSIFVDVELWNETSDGRQWSCPFLAAVWQLLRLGALRMKGESVVHPQPPPDNLPEQWCELAPIVQLNPTAAPFSAYRTFSVLAGRFMPIEQAVRTILSQVDVEPGVRAEITKRGSAEGLSMPSELVERIEYAFAGAPWRSAD
jgi:hypothetical protein